MNSMNPPPGWFVWANYGDGKWRAGRNAQTSDIEPQLTKEDAVRLAWEKFREPTEHAKRMNLVMVGYYAGRLAWRLEGVETVLSTDEQHVLVQLLIKLGALAATTPADIPEAAELIKEDAAFEFEVEI